MERKILNEGVRIEEGDSLIATVQRLCHGSQFAVAWVPYPKVDVLASSTLHLKIEQIVAVLAAVSSIQLEGEERIFDLQSSSWWIH